MSRDDITTHDEMWAAMIDTCRARIQRADGVKRTQLEAALAYLAARRAAGDEWPGGLPYTDRDVREAQALMGRLGDAIDG